MREQLVDLASRALAAGVAERRVDPPARTDWPDAFYLPRATFVTLSTAAGRLRGCRGQLEATRPLGDDVWFNAIASALDDPRFEPVAIDELDALRIEISVLSALEPLAVRSESALRRVLVPGRDGVVLTAGVRCATFLPKVWEVLPDPADFLGELKCKAGLPRTYWSAHLRVEVYRTESFSGRAGPPSSASQAAIAASL